MSEPQSATGLQGASREEMTAALFAQLVMQQANMAMMLLGKTPHPETGQTVKDIEAARFFIDQLEMLETKTRGNLSKEESGLLKQSLMSLRLAFVEAVEAPEAKPAMPSPGTQSSPGDAAKSSSEPVPSAAQEEEHRKKFSKKY
ncbi:MAG TPA: DUF1844 domain-containing protein [Verrucomicrobiae bacterium]|nr:DUF1844 domain-containing protein [Verrucomicrobiae bacterium]